jgi:hypothetical protein
MRPYIKESTTSNRSILRSVFMTRSVTLQNEERAHAKFNSDYHDDCYFDLRDLAQYSSISVRTLRDYLDDATDPLPSYCVKKKILVKKSEFDAWITKYRVCHKSLAVVVDDVLADVLAS